MKTKSLLMLLGLLFPIAFAAALTAKQEGAGRAEVRTDGWLCRNGELIGPVAVSGPLSRRTKGRCYIVAEPSQCVGPGPIGQPVDFGPEFVGGSAGAVQFMVYDDSALQSGREVRVFATGRVESAPWACNRLTVEG